MGSQHLEGLNLTRKFTIPCSQLTSPTDSLLTITLLLREMNIPFDLYRDIFFVDIHLEEDLRVLGDAGDHLLAKIREFACDMMLKPYNVGHNVLPMNLRILRYVRIPPVQYFAWESWFAKENESPCFGQAYKNAISRPRTKRELKYGINPENDDEVTNLAVLLSLGRKMMDLNLSN
ncbi:OLC1v1004798C1 [Oldenlandia corymbosa var. corymbosa]|uniref:OLC1v1004798C1 n=1 Tax=Oldenlandia corymbosa var. corymbosa TaxID=529605 RepID=A0AAV1DDC8_OLDCO|nr:OLC1v1004798C1 [Oldenlandia corymbosa var. corymbosa]